MAKLVAKQRRAVKEGDFVLVGLGVCVEFPVVVSGGSAGGILTPASFANSGLLRVTGKV